MPTTVPTTISKAQVNAPIIALIEKAVAGLPFDFYANTHYRSPAGYVEYVARLRPTDRGAAVTVVAKPGDNGIDYTVVLSDWSRSSSGMSTLDFVGVNDPTPASIRSAIESIIAN